MVHNSSQPQLWPPASFVRPTEEVNNNSPNETTSLLPPEQAAERLVDDVCQTKDEDASQYQLILREFYYLMKGSLPVVLAYSLQGSIQTVSVLIVGRLSPEALATAAFSYMFALTTGYLIAIGGTTAIDTLASASFTGSKNKHDLGVILQRSFIVLLIFYIPIAFMWFFSEPIFLALGQEAYIARDSARFLSVLIPGTIGYMYFEALKKYLQAQGA